jgi:hypothetical protein
MYDVSNPMPGDTDRDTDVFVSSRLGE